MAIVLIRGALVLQYQARSAWECGRRRDVFARFGAAARVAVDLVDACRVRRTIRERAIFALVYERLANATLLRWRHVDRI